MLRYRYNRSLNDLIFEGSDCSVKQFYHVHGSVDREQALIRADFWLELIAIRDRRIVL
jgi:hypothetical protein